MYMSYCINPPLKQKSLDGTKLLNSLQIRSKRSVNSQQRLKAQVTRPRSPDSGHPAQVTRLGSAGSGHQAQVTMLRSPGSSHWAQVTGSGGQAQVRPEPERKPDPSRGQIYTVSSKRRSFVVKRSNRVVISQQKEVTEFYNIAVPLS